MIQDTAEELGKGFVSVDALPTTVDASGSNASAQWDVKMRTPPASASDILSVVQKEINDTPAWIQASIIGGQVAGDTREKAIAALLASCLGTVAYLWFRFHRVEFGLAAVIAVIHDVFIALAFIGFSHYFVSLFGRVPGLGIEEFKISLPVVAAFLTLIGYSLNDTIVIFDRLREIRGKSHELTAKMINDSVNQTLSRTLLTTGTTLIVVLILYFMGGEGIHGFAFTLLIGLIAGTYSTVFIASPALLFMLGREKPDRTRTAGGGRN
jgi:SecD/SecF fusion protein